MRLDVTNVRNQSIEYFQNRVMNHQVKEQRSEVNYDEGQVSKDEVKIVTEAMNSFIEPTQTNLKFVYHEELNEYYVTVINPETNETIREIPPKKVLDMYAAMVGFMGILVDERV